MPTKSEALQEVTRLVRELLIVQAEGATAARFHSARASLDRAMLVLRRRGLFTDRELLALVADERRALFGPATSTFAALGLRCDPTCKSVESEEFVATRLQ